MNPDIFFVSDHHFNREAPYKMFTRDDGRFLRYEFANAKDGDEAMVERHNLVVNDDSRVYFVGDVAFHKKDLTILRRMRGRKVLIKGNHDTLELKDYLPYFDDIRGVHQFNGIILSHYPIHPASLGKAKINVHGHLHYRKVMTEFNEEDKRYFNVSVECINYTPISINHITNLINHE